MVAFASGGRRRSEIAALRVEQLSVEAPIEQQDSPPLPSLAIHLGRTKTASGEQDEVVYLTGQPVAALKAWMSAARIDKGSVFRGVRAVGHSLAARARSAVDQRHTQAAGGDGWAGTSRLLCPWAAFRLSDGSRQSRHSPSRGNGTIAPPFRPASLRLLQQRDTP